MIKIKAHDGPGRVGQQEEMQTPNIIDYKELNTVANIATPFKIQKEIAQENMQKTIQLAEKEEDKTKIAVIQGAQYTDLRVECAKQLEKLNYTKLTFANTDELQRNPEKLLEIVINVRQNINPNTTLYFPFATTQIIPILAYIGVDIFDTSRAIYEAKNDNIMTQTNIYPASEYNITDNIEEENLKQLQYTIVEIQQNMKNKTLRNLTEQRAATHPELMTLHRLLDKNHQNYLQKYTQLY